MNIFGIPAISIAVIESLYLEQYFVSVSYIVFFVPFSIITLFRKKLSYATLAAVPVIFCYILGTLNLIIWGFSGAGIPILLTFLVLTTLFYNFRTGLFMVLVNLFTIIIVGVLYLNRVLFLSVRLQDITLMPVSWITAWAVLTLLGTLIVISFGIIHNKLVQNLKHSENLSSKLNSLNRQLIDDIQKRIDTEARLKTSLEDKKVMLNEIHHRVKNNLQHIHSLLSLQEDYMESDHDRGLIHDSRMRIRSMAMVHEKLYSSESFSETNFLNYINELLTILPDYYQVAAHNIQFDINAESNKIDINLAVLCGQIITELASNTMKYAFPDSVPGIITVSFQQAGDDYILFYGDNGVGLQSDFTFPGTDTLGLKLVQGFIGQLNGSIEVKNEQGLYYTIVFPVKHTIRTFNPVYI